MRFAFYGRCSTEDAQDPVASRLWLVHRAKQLISAIDGEIVAEYFDVGQSRSLPWSRRDHAARLLLDLENPLRGWDAVVIAEPHRAFYWNQFSLTFPVFEHYGVQLWVPEVGGPVDPGSAALEMLMTMFGGFSKEERSRVKGRVRDTMRAMAAEGTRFLGGRPPYGYRLTDNGPHPNPSKAAAGLFLHVLEPNPDTAPVVGEIFRMYAEGLGLREIAARLTEAGIPSPSAYDPARNRHRDPRGWTHTAIRSILLNPIYVGRKVWGKQERHEELLDVKDVAAGHITRMRWRSQADWIEAATNDTPPLILDMDVRQRVAARFGARSGQRRPRESHYGYSLRGILFCGMCGRRMQGSARRSRRQDRVRMLYRCEFGSTRAIPADMDHPSTLYVAEQDIVQQLDEWLAEMATPEALAAAQSPPPGAIADDGALKSKIANCDDRLNRLLDAVESGGLDLDVLGPRIAKVRNERDELERRRRSSAKWKPLSDHDVEALATELGGTVQVLAAATPAEKADIYASLGVRLDYDHEAKQVNVRLDLSRVAKRVGGGT